MSLKFPDCKNSLKSVHYEGVRVHLCMSCKGFFLKPNELKRIQETQEREVYMDSCPLCRKLETGFKPLLAKRPDVYIRRVHFPEGGLQFSFDGTSQAEVEAQVAETNRLMESYSLCGTPHVLVFYPDKNTLAADSCKSRDGTRFLQSWINTETGSLPDLLEGITRL